MLSSVNTTTNSGSNPLEEMEEIEEILAVMRMHESGFYSVDDYLRVKVEGKDVVDESWRQRMCEWMYGVVDHCNFRRDIVAVSAGYLDIVLTKDRSILYSRRTFQLAAMTCLYLAMKVYDTSFVKLESLIKLGRGLFTVDDVIAMEDRILTKILKWRVHPPTAMCFLRHYTRLFPSCLSPSTAYMISEVSRFIAEISVCLYKFVKYKPSAVAMSALMIAMEGIDDTSLPLGSRKLMMQRMKVIAKMDLQSAEMQQLTRRLRASFEKNVDVRALMTTIDPNCVIGYSSSPKIAKRTSTNSNSNGSPKDVTQTNNLGK